MSPRDFLGVYTRKIVYFYIKFYTIFRVKITEKSCEKPRKIMWAHTKNRVTLHEKLRKNSCESHENSWRPTREIRVISHEKSRKFQFSRVSLFNWKNVCRNMIFYVISHEKSCIAFLKLVQKRCRCPKNHLLFVLFVEILFIYVSNDRLIARNRREDPKRIQVGQFYGPTFKNTFASIIFKKIVSKNCFKKMEATR